jgi:chitinase
MPETTGGRRQLSPVLIGAILVALIALAGIAWMLRSTMGGGSKAAAPVGITIYPTAAKAVVGKSVDFSATVTGAPTSEVTWKVEEGDNAGQVQTRPGAYSKDDGIQLYSTYTAPKTPGTYHLVATSTADASKSATAEITVVAK